LAPNTSTSLQITLVADAHVAEGQFLHDKQPLNKAKSLMYRAMMMMIMMAMMMMMMMIIIIIIIIILNFSMLKQSNNFEVQFFKSKTNFNQIHTS
jgi:hypothetical protein